jgi:hypothetical protein
MARDMLIHEAKINSGLTTLVQLRSARHNQPASSPARAQGLLAVEVANQFASDLDF